MSSTGILSPHTATPAPRRLPRGFGLLLGAALSLAMWLGLARLALGVLGG